MTIRLDEALHKRLRFRSVETGEPLQQMVVRLLREELEHHETPKRRRRRTR